MLCLFVADIAQPGYLKFWQPDLNELSTLKIKLPFLKPKKDNTTLAPRKDSTCSSPDNDLEAVLQARFGCKDAPSD